MREQAKVATTEEAELPQPTASVDHGFEQAGFRAGGLPSKYQDASLVAFERKGGSTAIVNQLIAWLDRGADRWLYLHGPAGVGKSSLVAALACLLIGHGRDPQFWPVMKLMDRARDLIGKGHGQADIFDVIARLDVLILDDFGRELGTPWALERMRLLVGERYDNERLTIFTSNLSLGQIGKQVDEPLAWRIRELAEVIHIPGPNLRAAAVRQQQPPETSVLAEAQVRP